MTHDYHVVGTVPIIGGLLEQCSRCNRTLYSEEYRNYPCHGKPDEPRAELRSRVARARRKEVLERKAKCKTQST